jgi:hypothetical protein
VVFSKPKRLPTIAGSRAHFLPYFEGGGIATDGLKRKPLQEQMLNGTYRACSHSALPNLTRGYTCMDEYTGPASGNGAIKCESRSDAEGRYAGLDFDYERKMLVGAESLAWCFECDASTIRRWAGNGTMPKPLKVGGRTLWDAERIREWIRRGCPRCND